MLENDQLIELSFGSQSYNPFRGTVTFLATFCLMVKHMLMFRICSVAQYAFERSFRFLRPVVLFW